MRPYIPSETTVCSWRLWQLWWNLVRSAGEFRASHPPGDGPHCVLISGTLRPKCGDVYAPSEWHVCCTVRRGSSYAVAVYTMPGDVYAILRLSATFCVSAIAIYRMPPFPHICLAWSYRNLWQNSVHFGYIACRCICFAIIVFYRSEIYCSILTLSSTMPSVLHILCWSIISLQCFFLLIYIRFVPIIAVIPVDIAGSQVKLLEFSRSPSLPDGGWDGIPLVAFITFIFIIPSALWHPEMQFVIHAIVVYRDVWVSASDLRLLKCHFRGQIVQKNSIVNTSCFHTDDHGRRWVLRLLDLMLDCSKSVFIHPLLVALRYCVPIIHQECIRAWNASLG